MRRFRILLAMSLCAAAAPAMAACYTVYDGSNHVMFQSDKPPVDMSLPLHETVPKQFPGGHLVFDQSSACPVISPVVQGDGGPITRTSSPLLTNESTARKLRVPHSSVNGIAVVPATAVAMRPGVTVVPFANPTAVLGGPPAPAAR